MRELKDKMNNDQAILLAKIRKSGKKLCKECSNKKKSFLRCTFLVHMASKNPNQKEFPYKINFPPSKTIQGSS